jgi:hypothetical protein
MEFTTQALTLPTAFRRRPTPFDDRNQLAPGALWQQPAARPSPPCARSAIQGVASRTTATPLSVCSQRRLTSRGWLAIFGLYLVCGTDRMDFRLNLGTLVHGYVGNAHIAAEIYVRELAANAQAA